ncbi:restriction endonuclease subunit S [Chromobacterium sp. IIBBL 290-4]|uniref:restriction endonuclease subunit S n=1 Tax=Chromobacterium sp. IIBBL 290-4 TaxID=2953890 RepID=UPI0020B79BC1|nr:restriction endonuclease subunit S [Chromobacterium sp. IIBBL 290-4]UTH75664.1 restriction endonuclease subunit S [Chromobacterium sp. IIBBL 290-4]
MDAQQFLEEFGHIANAPGGVGKLRELILSLAFKGELCVPSNEISATLLDDIERQRLEFNGETRKQRLTRQSNTTTNLVGPYEIPKHWSWVSLSTVGHTWGQKKPEDSFVYIDVSSIDNKAGVLRQSPEVISASAAPSRARKVVKKGTLVYSTVRPYLLNIAIIDRDFDLEPIASTAFAIVHPWEGISGRYLYFYLRSPIFVRYVESVQIGMAYPAISDEKFYSGVVPLPPTEEQSRIVAKVDELMALCDKLEAQQQARRKLQNALRQSTLQAVASATSPHELQTTWACLADNFGRLFHEPEDVDDLVAELKNLAVRGLLSEASTTSPDLEAIKIDCAQMRARYIADGLIRRQKLVGMADCEETYPAHWAVTAFDEVAIVIGGVTKGRDLRGKQVMVCPYLSVANVQRGHFKLEGLKSIEIAADELAKYQVHEGDLLITEGGDWDKVGRTALWRGGVTNCLHQNHVFKARVPSKQLLNEWVELVFNSGVGRDYFAGASKQTTNLASINMTQLRSFALPIPPLIEQQRILSVLSELTKHCNEWCRQMERKQAMSTLLAGAVVSSLTGITIEQEEEPMKAPQTELVAPLRLGTTPDIKAQAPLATILARHHGEMSAKDLWQRFGGEIDAFYTQLKTEVAHGWILEPAPAEMREKLADSVSA